MGIQLQKVPSRLKYHREANFFNNSVIYKNVELKFSMDGYSGPMISENNINLISHGIFLMTHTWGGGEDSSGPL